MKQTVDKYKFHTAFHDCGRGDNFSYEGREALFEYLEEYEASCGMEMELDVVALCCDFSEHNSAMECIKDCGYGWEPDVDLDEEENEEAALEYLHRRTTVITFDGGVIIQK